MNSDVYKIYEMVDNFCKSNDSNILPSSVVNARYFCNSWFWMYFLTASNVFSLTLPMK